MLPLPLQKSKQTKYYSCCGKIVCVGCIVSAREVGINNHLCPFCRAPGENAEGILARMSKRIEANDPEAMCEVGIKENNKGNHTRAIELWTKAADLGLCTSHFNLGIAYNRGEGVKVDLEKARYHWETSAMAGHGGARLNLGMWEMDRGNTSIGMKHCMVAAKSGYNDSLNMVKEGFVNGNVTRTDFEDTLRHHKESLQEMKSEQRNHGAALYPFTPSLISWREYFNT